MPRHRQASCCQNRNCIVHAKGCVKPALLSADSAAILDHGSHIFIWLGREVAAAMPDPNGDGRWTRTTVVCERWATRLAAGRFPVPELVTVTEVRARQTRGRWSRDQRPLVCSTSLTEG